MEDHVTASVVICAYTMERWSILVESVASVRAQTQPPIEIIVVIDGNEELLTLARAELDGATVVPNKRQRGTCGARNTGCALARGNVFVFLDDDAVPEPDWLERLLAHYDDDDVMGVGGRVLPDWRSGRPNWFPAEFNWVVGCSWTGLPDTLAEVRNLICANLSVRREVFAAVGGFPDEMARIAAPDETFMTGTAEETEFCIRASKAHPGGRWLYAPDARVHHVVSKSRLTWTFFVDRCRVEGDSKAILTRLAGAARGLESERHYVRAVLPRAVLRELLRGCAGDVASFRRAGAIVAGLAVTATFYARGRVLIALRPPRVDPA
jgi:GT2 family glycosyltransferase